MTRPEQDSGEDRFDEPQILARIRDGLRADSVSTRSAAPPAATDSNPSRGSHGVEHDLHTLHAEYDVLHVPVTSHRGFLGAGVVHAKRALLRLLVPLVQRQTTFNAANTRVVQTLYNTVEALRRETAQASNELKDLAGLVSSLNVGTRSLTKDLTSSVRNIQAQLAASVSGLQTAIVPLQTEMARRGPIVDSVRERVARVERRLRALITSLETAAGGERVERVQEDVAALEAPPKTVPAAGTLTEAEFDYAGFEERFRGSEAEIKERQRRYVPLFEGCGTVLDIGCGRGEFLELLREAGAEGRGIELNTDAVLLCRDKSLDVVQGDAFAYLDGVPDGSLGGIFSAQFIEHFPPPQIVRLARTCYRKLGPGGVLLFETVNAGCLAAFARAFYLDFTHVWPYHPEATKFVLEMVGFADVRLDFSAPVEASLPHAEDDKTFGAKTQRLNRAVDLLNTLVLGHQDYAVIGVKPTRG